MDGVIGVPDKDSMRVVQWRVFVSSHDASHGHLPRLGSGPTAVHSKKGSQLVRLSVRAALSDSHFPTGRLPSRYPDVTAKAQTQTDSVT